MRVAGWAGVVALVLVGCGRVGDPGRASAGADAGERANASVDAGANIDAGAGATEGACRGGRAFGGVYRSVAGGLYVPADWKGVRWRVPESSEGLGEGTLSLRCDPESGRLTGRVDGVLGPATLRGVFDDAGVVATVVRADPADHGFTGTLAATLVDGHARGSMHVSLGEAGAIRVAAFDLTPMDAGAP